jgi:hydroxyethylthiazole kinase-like uncharacterized protein yjeF
LDNLRVVDRAAARALVQRVYRIPQAADNKYTRGVVRIVTGSQAFPGAAILSCSGAVWAGAGLVRYYDLEQLKFSVIAARPEVVVQTVQSDTELLTPSDQSKTGLTAWVVGCGIDPRQSLTVTQVNHLLAHYTVDSPDAGRFLPPLVLDASGLELLFARVSPAVLITPHRGEATRLWTRWSGGAEIPADPFTLASELQRLTGASVLLKGNTTYWAGPAEAYAITSPSAWQAQAGTGDVLAGLLGALLAQNANRLTNGPGHPDSSPALTDTVSAGSGQSDSGTAPTDVASAGFDSATTVPENPPVNLATPVTPTASVNSVTSVSHTTSVNPTSSVTFATPVTPATSVNCATSVSRTTSVNPTTPVTPAASVSLGEVAMAAIAIFNQTPDVAPHRPLPALQLARTIPAAISNLLN